MKVLTYKMKLPKVKAKWSRLVLLLDRDRGLDTVESGEESIDLEKGQKNVCFEVLEGCYSMTFGKAWQYRDWETDRKSVV